MAEEWVWHQIGQCIAHRKILGIKLVQVKAARIHVDPMVAHVGEINYVVGRGRVLKSVHPLLKIVSLSIATDSVNAETDIGQAVQRASYNGYESA